MPGQGEAAARKPGGREKAENPVLSPGVEGGKSEQVFYGV